MDRRSEPRFENYTPVKLRPLDRSEFKLECTIVDISGAGMRIVAPESLPEGAIVGLEFADQIVLANVCRSQAFGDKFALGAQRIHTVSKAAPLRKKAEMQQVRTAIEECRERKRATIGGADSPAALSEEELAQLDGQLQEYFEQCQLEPAETKSRRREDAVKRILDRINRPDRPAKPKVAQPSLVRVSEMSDPAPEEIPPAVPVPVERKSGPGKCGLPSWFTASLAKRHS